MLSNQGANLNPNMIMQIQRDAYKLYVHKYNIVYFKLNTALKRQFKQVQGRSQRGAQGAFAPAFSWPRVHELVQGL